MSTSSSRARHRKARLHRPLDPARMAEGRKLAQRYQIVIWNEDGQFFGRGLELPYTFEDAPTAEECITKLREAMAETVELMLEMGQQPPVPLLEADRTAQVNIRVTPQEKSILEHAAKAHGFNGVSEYVRSRALAS